MYGPSSMGRRQRSLCVFLLAVLTAAVAADPSVAGPQPPAALADLLPVREASQATLARANGSQCVALPTGLDARVPYNPTVEYKGFEAYTQRLKQNAYPLVDPTQFPYRLPGGITGLAITRDEIAGLAKERAFAVPYTLELAGRAMASCKAANASGSCITTIESFQTVWYSSLPDAYRPDMSAFPYSDAAFARMRLTVDPFAIQAASALPAGVNAAEVQRYISQTCVATLQQMLQRGRVYTADYRRYAPLVAPSPNTNLQLPVVLFVVDQGEFKVVSITLDNGLTYTPLDNRYDWLLAKAYTNALSTSVVAAIHFINNHFVLNNLCISAQRNFYPKHPLAVLLSIPCQLNTGIIDSGVAFLLPPGSIFDRWLAVNSTSLATKLLPYLADTYNWTDNYIAVNLARRGIADIPGFAYAQDAGTLYDSFRRYAHTYLRGVYMTMRPRGASMSRDRQLMAFLADVSAGGPAAIPGFPQPTEAVASYDSLAQVLAQVMWLAAEHHALNSNKVLNYDTVWPSNPGRVWAAPPPSKGTLTETTLIQTYLLPPVLPHGGPGTKLLVDAIELGVFFSLDPQLSQQATVRTAYASVPLISPGCRGGAAAAAAAALLGVELTALTNTIARREAALAGTVPPFTLLDPKQLPSWTMI